MSQIGRRWTHALFLMFCIVQGAIAGVPEKAGPCTVPVRNGHPTDEDFGQSFRMISKFVMLPGVRRPVLYPWRRNGAWTIDDQDTFVPFPGEFPSNSIHDSFERDPKSGRIIGVGFEGVFAIEPGEIEFRSIIRKGELDIKDPRPTTFIPRLSGFMFLALNGLYMVDQNLNTSHLRLDNPPALINPGDIVDLPGLEAVLINDKSRVYIRTDDGHSVLLASLESWDFLTNATVGPSGDTILLESYRNAFEVKILRAHDGTIMEPTDAKTVRARPENKSFNLRPSSTRLQKEFLKNYASSPIPVRGESIVIASDGLYLFRNWHTRDQGKCN